MKKVVVVGTGYVGLPAALMWAKSGLEVVGVDIRENVVRAINERTMLINEDKLQALLDDPVVQANLIALHEPTEADAFVIAVPTPVDPLRKTADLSHVVAAIASIIPRLRKGNLVIIESTIPPLTTVQLAKQQIEAGTGLRVPDDILLAHCPERILPGDIWYEIVHNDRLIGGIDPASTAAATALYATFVKGALIPTTATVAEMGKIMENVFRDVNIALANECALICERIGVDAGEVIALANRHPRVNVLSPGIGVGGHCIPVDPWFLKEVAPLESRLITTARLVNDEMPSRMAAKIRAAVKGVVSPKIVALGAAYKRDCEDCRESPAIEIVTLLRGEGFSVAHYDPLVSDMKYNSLGDVTKDADLIVVLVHHKIIAAQLALTETMLPPLLDLDPR